MLNDCARAPRVICLIATGPACVEITSQHHYSEASGTRYIYHATGNTISWLSHLNTGGTV